MTYTFEDPAHVQYTLDNLEPMQPFKVIFMTQKGEQREYIGTLDPNATVKRDSVAMLTSEGWKRFSLDRVLWIGESVE